MSEPLALVPCERRALRLLEASCARLWLSCRRAWPDPWEGRWPCATCPAGAERAGRMAEPPTPARALRDVCTRCRAEGGRMVGGLLCISCYNRHREALRGRNAKGTRPGLADRLHTVRLEVAGRPVRVEAVTGRVEAMLALGKRQVAPGPIAFGRPPLDLPGGPERMS